VLLIANDPGHDPHHPGRLLSEQDITVARIADRRIAAAFDWLEISLAHDRCRTTTGSAHTTWSPCACPSRPRPMSRTEPRIDIEVCRCGHVESHPRADVTRLRRRESLTLVMEDGLADAGTLQPARRNSS
jgi:hypothetical protein